MNRKITLTILVAVLALATMACELSGILVENPSSRHSAPIIISLHPASSLYQHTAETS